jgi:hypothetical protein
MVGWWRVLGVRVAGVLFGPVEGALAGLAEFFFVGGGAVGFGFSVGHDCTGELLQRFVDSSVTFISGERE